MLQITPRGLGENVGGEKHHRQGEHPRGPLQQGHHVGRNVPGLGHVHRPGVHHDLHHAQARYQPTPQLLTHLRLTRLARHEIVGGHGLVTGSGQSIEPLRRTHFVRRPGDLGAVRGPVDGGLFDTGHRTQSGFDIQSTSGAMHALHHHLRRPCGRCSAIVMALGFGLAEGGPALRVVEQGIGGIHTRQLKDARRNEA